VQQLTLEVLEPAPVRSVALPVAVVALAHPQEPGGELHRFVGVEVRRRDGPAVVVAGPGRLLDAVPVSDVAGEVVLLDDLAEVLQDLLAGGDRIAAPWLEAVAEREEVAVGPHAGISMRQPGAAVGRQRVEDDERRPWPLVLQVIGGTDAGDPGTDHHHVEVFTHGHVELPGRRRSGGARWWVPLDRIQT
jgi:hypothetical protein